MSQPVAAESPPRFPQNIDDAFEWFHKHFDAEAARGLCLVYQYELKGEAGGTCTARIDDGRLEVGRGGFDGADVIFKMEASDFFAMLAGRANADMLFMEDRILVTGDLSLALKMRRIFGARA